MGLKGITVRLYTETQTGTDEFNNPVYSESYVDVDNVLVGEPTSDDIINSTELYGKKAVFTLGIPKSDANNWENKKVEFFGQTFRTFGAVIKGIDHLVPLSWNAKVKVERYG